MPAIVSIDGADFGNFGAAVDQNILQLQAALKSLGNTVGSAQLKALVTDGINGPKTTAATNWAFTNHIGPGQSPAQWRTGALTQAQVSANAATLANLVRTEIARRGGTLVAATVKKAAAKVSTVVPAAVYTPPAAAYVPAAASNLPSVPSGAGGSGGSIVMWSAIGLGLVTVAGIAYYVIKRRGVSMADGHLDSAIDEHRHEMKAATRKARAYLRRVDPRQACTAQLRNLHAASLQAAAAYTHALAFLPSQPLRAGAETPAADVYWLVGQEFDQFARRCVR